MKRKFFLTMLFVLAAIPLLADDIVMITRDGSMIPVKVEKISSSQVTFIDLKHKKRGRLNAPTDFVYMIMKEKGNNIFFDEEGNQTTAPVVKFDKDDNVMFLNRGEMFVIYNVSVGKDEISYQLKDKKKAPWIKRKKDEVFMIRNSDGTTTLYNDSYQEKQKQKQQNVAPSTSTPLATQTMPSASAPASLAQPTPAAQPSANNAPMAATGQQLLASATVETGFHPAPDMSPADIEMAVNAKNPYTLYRKGSMAEYCFQYDGKQTQYKGSGPTYLRQIVDDEKIVNGLLVAYIRQELYNKKHEPSKGIMASFKEILFPVEIDTAGTYHLTHNLAQDFLVISKRRGYGLMIPGNLQPGMQLQCSTLYDTAKNILGGTAKLETTYSNWNVVAQESITTPAGTFDCVKLTGRLAQKMGSNGKFAGENITCWIARGIGIVQYETTEDRNKEQKPFIFYLNKLELK